MQNIVFNTTLLHFENLVHNLDHPLHADLKPLSKLNPTSSNNILLASLVIHIILSNVTYITNFTIFFTIDKFTSFYLFLSKHTFDNIFLSTNNSDFLSTCGDEDRWWYFEKKKKKQRERRWERDAICYNKVVWLNWEKLYLV